MDISDKINHFLFLGICLGNIEGHIAITYFTTTQSVKDNYIFKCHRLNNNNGAVNFEDVYAVCNSKYKNHFYFTNEKCY